MSVKELKADVEVGYWEYEVQTDDGTWHVECGRGPKIPASEAAIEDTYDKYKMHLHLRLDGKELFDSHNYDEESIMFLTPYDVNNTYVVSIAIYAMALWFAQSNLNRKFAPILEKIKDLMADTMGDEAELAGVAVASLDWGGAMANPDLPLMSEADCERLQSYGTATNNLHGELYDHGVALMTPEWRLKHFGTDDLPRHGWGNNPYAEGT